jgi:putative oxidoreductase
LSCRPVEEGEWVAALITSNHQWPLTCIKAMEVRAISLANVFTGEHVMLITFDDFRIRAENFDPSKTANILRIMCGAFMFPHVAGKFVAGGLSAGTVGFFAKAGFHPAEVWVYIAAAVETLCGVALVFGICTRYAALGAAAVLAIAVYSLQVVKGFGWTWNTGGYEYPVFWGIVSMVVAVEAWRTYLASSKPAGIKNTLARA